MSDTPTTDDAERKRAAAGPTTYLLEELFHHQGPEGDPVPAWALVGAHQVPGGTRRATALLMCVSQHPELKQRLLADPSRVRIIPRDEVYEETVGRRPAPDELAIQS